MGSVSSLEATNLHKIGLCKDILEETKDLEKGAAGFRCSIHKG